MKSTMILRSTRSKSRTPVTQTVIDENQSEELQNHVSVSKTVTTSISTKSTYKDMHPAEIIDSNTKHIDKNTKVWQSNKKSQYSSFFSNEDEVTSTNVINQNLSNQSIEDSHSFSSIGSSLSALDVYRAAGDYWNKYPKTDYTYSRHSRDRKEIAPGVVAMPNMSRKSLHEYTAKDYKNDTNHSFLRDEVDYSTKTDSWVTSATKLKPQTLFSNKYKEHSYKSSTSTQTSIFTKIITVFKNIFVTTLTLFYFIYTILNSTFLWIGKKIHKLTTHVMLYDTWLLQYGITRTSKRNSILALCLIPLLLFGGWWLFSGLGPILLGTDTTKTIANTPVNIKAIDNIVHTTPVANEVKGTLTSEQLQEITKLLVNPGIQNIDDLKEDIVGVRLDLQKLQRENAEKIAQLTYQLNRCCRSSYIQIENYVKKVLGDLLGAPNYLTKPDDISRWLHSTFVAKHDLEMQLNNLTRHLQSDYNTLIEHNAKLIMDKVMGKVLSELNTRIEKVQKYDILSEINVDSLTDEYIKKIVQDTLAVYDADKTGLVDYALETAGGQVLSTRCTESYHARTAVFSVFGIPLWYLGNTPRTVIMPGVTPGECWAFQNFPGFLVIKLASPIKIQAFSLEHISKMLAPSGKIDSAPKEFYVFGLKNETDKEPQLLGQYKYDSNGPPLQYFAAQAVGLVFNIIELRIHSNHGNPNYTCLYRFRVHGILSDEPT